MSTLHLIYGLPCSGKTTLAKKIQSEHSALVLTPDEWMARIVGDGYDEKKRAVIEKIQWEIAQQALHLGVDVILECGNWTRKERDELRTQAKNTGADVKFYFLDVPHDELMRRLRERNKNLPPHTFHIKESDLEEWMTKFEPPTPDEDK